MSEALTLAYQTIDDANADKPAATRRQLVAGAAAALGTMGVLGWAADDAEARHRVDPAELLAVAATAEVLATIVNTVGYEQVSGLDAITRKNIAAAAREELIHFQTLTSAAVGARSSRAGSGSRTPSSRARPSSSPRSRWATPCS